MIALKFLRYISFFYFFSCITDKVQYDSFRKTYSLDDSFYSGNEYHLLPSIRISSLNDRLMHFLYPDYEFFLKSFQELEKIYKRYDLSYKNDRIIYNPRLTNTPEDNLTLIWFSSIYLYSKIPNKYIKVVYETIRSYRPITLLLDRKTCLQFEVEDRLNYDKFFQFAISNGALRIMLVEELEFNDKKLNELHKKYLLPNAIGGNPVVSSDAYRFLLHFHDCFCINKNTYIDFDMLESVLENNLWYHLHSYVERLDGQIDYTCSKKQNNNDIVGAKRVQIEKYKEYAVNIFTDQIPFYLKSMKNISNTFSNLKNIGECIKNGQTLIYGNFNFSILKIPIDEKFEAYANTWSEDLLFFLRRIEVPCPTLELCLRLLYYAKKYSLHDKDPYILPKSVYKKRVLDIEKLCRHRINENIVLESIFEKSNKKSDIEKIIQKHILKNELSIEDKKYIIESSNFKILDKQDIDILLNFEKNYREKFDSLCTLVFRFLKNNIIIEEEINSNESFDSIVIDSAYMNEKKDNDFLYKLDIHYPHRFSIKQQLILDKILCKDELLLSAFLDRFDPKIYMKESNFLNIYKFGLINKFKNEKMIIYTNSMLTLFLRNQINELFYKSPLKIVNPLLFSVNVLIEKNLFEKFISCIDHNYLIFDKVGCLDHNVHNIFCSIVNEVIIINNEQKRECARNDIFSFLKQKNIINKVESISIVEHLDKFPLLKEICEIDTSIRNLDIKNINFNFIKNYIELINSRKLNISIKDSLHKLDLKLLIENDNSDDYLPFYKDVIRFFDNWQDYKSLEEYSKKYKIYSYPKRKKDVIELIVNCHPDTFYQFAEDFSAEINLKSKKNAYKVSSIEMALISSFLVNLNNNDRIKEEYNNTIYRFF